jgi:murein L,D-transpeptidase YcbB/YkuD
MLPELKKNPYYLNGLKIEVLQNGKVVPQPEKIDWQSYSANNFPFELRQKPGCHNSLGLLKFDFPNPFSTYLHDTNNKTAFLAGRRFFSHGCFRVEEPGELAVALGIPADKINMDTCLTGKKPQIFELVNPVPVFIIYATVDVVNGELRWFEDAYKIVGKN